MLRYLKQEGRDTTGEYQASFLVVFPAFYSCTVVSHQHSPSNSNTVAEASHGATSLGANFSCCLRDGEKAFHDSPKPPFLFLI